jgi:hypothetical protein
MTDKAPILPADNHDVEYVWSYDDEFYLASNICPSVDEALSAAHDGMADAGLGNDRFDYCTIGRVQRYNPEDFFPTAADILDHLRDEAAGSDAGEHAANSGWLDDVEPEHAARLNDELKAVLQNFFNRHPEYSIGNHFFTVEDVEDYDLVPQDDEDDDHGV